MINAAKRCVVARSECPAVRIVIALNIAGMRGRVIRIIVIQAAEAQRLGAGEILLTSMDRDGTKKGFDIELTKTITKNVNVPIIASGGAGKIEDFYEVFTKGKADAALAASLFHFGELKIKKLKQYLANKKLQIKLD